MKYFLLIFITLITFQSVLGDIVPFFNYLDELVTVLALILLLIKRIKGNKKIKKDDIRIVILYIGFIIIGLVGNSLTKMAGINGVIEDILAFSKLIIVFLFFDKQNLSEKTRCSLQSSLYRFCKLLIVIMFICAVITQVYNFGMGHDPRYGLTSFKFIFFNAPALNTFFYYFASLFSLTIYNNRFRKNATVYVVMMTVTWMLTLRSRAIAFALMYFLIYLFAINQPKRIRNLTVRRRYVILGILIAIIVGWDSFFHYFFENSNQVRYIMSRKGLYIAETHFPIGSGFATFGTEASRKYYSPMYSQLGIANIWGISKDTGASFILDQFWFGVLGQFGFFGLILFLCIIVLIYKRLWRYSKNNKGAQLACITFIFTTFLGSISAATYIHSYTIASVIVLLLLIPYKKAME